ncbi:MAG TPA: hypothetical protein HPP77_00875 [Candidatus Hydrogenedentes bacterium]|nr:hypothetical protein [Candidatus Hydrogenedentota bacterium]HIJ74481.1 hypothetical protein [Candidatus Hydrogenedentota bacterium]
MMQDPVKEAVAKAPRRARWRCNRYLWLVGVALYLGVVWLLGVGKLRDAVVTVNVKLILALMAVEAVAEWLRAGKWRFALGAGSNGVGLFFLSKATGYWTPGRVGELSPLLIRRHRTPKVGAWIIVDRVLETGATLVLGVVGLILLRIPGKTTFLLVAVATVALLAGAAYVLTKRGLFEWVAERVRRAPLLSRAAAFLAAISDEIKALRRKLPLASGVTVAATCLDLWATVLLYQSFGHDSVTFALAAAVYCVHGITGAIPFTPNATGLPYAAAAALLIHVADIPIETVVTAMTLQLAALNLVFWANFGLGAWDLRKHRG